MASLLPNPVVNIRMDDYREHPLNSSEVEHYKMFTVTYKDGSGKIYKVREEKANA